MPAPVKIMAVLVARTGRAEELKALLEGLIVPSRAEAGNLRYDLWRDQANPDRFVLDELYSDMAAVAAHRSTPHFLGYLALVNGLAERSSTVLDPLDVR
jgi:quinol monooxygenase YgiN